MQETSQLYKDILISNNYYVETSVAIGEAGRLITESGDIIRFGGDAILLSVGGQDSGYGDEMLLSVKTTRRVFKDNKPQVGCCTSGEIYVEMFMPTGEIQPTAIIMPYVRLVSRDTGEESEWLRKGIFYIDSRENTQNDDGLNILTIHGYDAMMRADAVYPSTSLSFPATDIQVVDDIAHKIGVSVEARTRTIINMAYDIQVPVQYTMREVLGYIGSMYAGNWIINDVGELQLIPIYDLPEETSLLLDENGYYITFYDSEIGEGVRIML